MLLRANSFLLKSKTILGGVFHPLGLRRTNKLRFYSSSSEMDKKKEQSSKDSRDAMSSSFGEGYATRSDEEGFGQIHSDAQQLNKYRKEINENSPEGYDKSQGREVKEKEKGGNLISFFPTIYMTLEKWLFRGNRPRDFLLLFPFNLYYCK